MYLAKLTARGQITIPFEVRDKLGVKPGDKVAFYEEDGETFIENSSKLELKKTRGTPGGGTEADRR